MDKLPEEEEDPGQYNATEAEKALESNSHVDVIQRASFLR
jgi:hypothetical protein